MTHNLLGFSHLQKVDYANAKHFAEQYHWNHSIGKVSDLHLYFIIIGNEVEITQSDSFFTIINNYGMNNEIYECRNKGKLLRTFRFCFDSFLLPNGRFTKSERINRFISEVCIKKN